MMFNVDDLVEQKLVIAKDVGNGNTMYKYHRKVFYDNLWHLDSRLLECRGIIVDKNGIIIQRPFKKVFNYGENNTFVDPEKEVIAVRKVNGFMCAVSDVISTTGSTTSKFVDIARKYIHKNAPSTHTWLFEICDESDPHIISEEYGAYLIGARDKVNGSLLNENTLDEAIEWFKDGYDITVKRPEWKVCRFSDVLSEVKTVKHEGFMIIDPETNEHSCKLKSPYYLSKKFLQRMSDTKIEQMFANPNKFKHIVEEEFFSVIDHITSHYKMEEWKVLTEQEKSGIISACYFMEVVSTTSHLS